MLTFYPPALLPAEYPTRLLRLCQGKLAPLLDPRSMPSVEPMMNGGGKRGKKRARGAEDGLVGGLEGRESKTVSWQDSEVIMKSFKRPSSP